MNKQEVIEEIKKLSIEKNGISHDKGNIDGIGLKDKITTWDVIRLLKKLDEPQKVTIPEFVAKWVDAAKKTHNNLSWIWFSSPASDEMNKWLSDHTETFMRAYLDGYEVEQEQLYHINLGRHIGRKFYLRNTVDSQKKWRISEIAFFAEKLTEKQIKEIDEHLWPFSEPVEVE